MSQLSTRWISIVGVLLSIGFVWIAANLLTTTDPDTTGNAVPETANTTHYSNDTLGISFNYPGEWIQVANDPNAPEWLREREGEVVSFYLPDAGVNASSNWQDGLFDITVENKPAEEPLQRFYEDRERSRFEQCEATLTAPEDLGGGGCRGLQQDYSEWEELIIAGRTALRGERESPGNVYPNDQVYISNGGQILRLEAANYGLNEDGDQYVDRGKMQIIDTIIQSLKFTSKLSRPIW